MKIVTLTAIIGTSMLLAACTPSAPPPPTPEEAFKAEVQSAVARKLKDPGSAQFGQMNVSLSSKMACGDVNAKNGFGGYTGSQSFAYDDGMIVFENEGRLWDRARARCIDAAKKEAYLASKRTLTSLEASDFPPQQKAKMLAITRGTIAEYERDHPPAR